MRTPLHFEPRAAALLVALLGGGSAIGGDLSVVEAVWTTSVVNRQYGPKVAPNSPARPLYFWTKLKGGTASLEALQKEGKLPIKHHWKFSNVFRAGGEDREPDQEGKVLSAGDIRDQGGITALVSEGGAFTWRTWTHKQSMWGGTWTVTVLYATGEPVMCNDKPCSWTIKMGE